MKDKQAYFNLWCISLVLLILIFVLFVVLVSERSVAALYFLIATIIAFSVLYRISIKNLTFPDGYSMIEAMIFQIKCDKQTTKKSNHGVKLQKIINDIAKKYDFCDGLTDVQIMNLYKTGKQANDTIKIPDLLLFKIIFKR